MARGGQLELDRVTKRYGSVLAVDDMSLHVPAGELVSLLGPSGSGKTTTLSLIGGFVPMSRGRIFVDGTDLSHLPPHRRNLGVVFQDYALFPHMTVEENVMFPLSMRSVAKDIARERVGQMLEVVHLSGYQPRYPRQLSGGQRQRVALARALVFDPTVLLMDEPLGALDKKLRDEMQQEIRRLHEEMAITIVTVTHDQEEALMLSDRIAVMNEGRIEQLGTPRDIYDFPRTAFVADFMGESNFLDGTVAGPDSDCLVVKTDIGATMKVAQTPEPISPGSRVRLMVRPERIQFLSALDTMANVVTGRIADIVFLGDTFRFRVAVGEDCVLTVKRPSWAQVIPLERGAAVEMGWSPCDCMVFAPEQPSRDEERLGAEAATTRNTADA